MLNSVIQSIEWLSQKSNHKLYLDVNVELRKRNQYNPIGRSRPEKVLARSILQLY